MRSKALKVKAAEAAPAKVGAKAAAKPKAKAKAKAAKEYDYSAFEKGMRLQAESGGTYYAAEVVTVKPKSKAPLRVRFVGYTAASDEWVGADRIRSKHLKVKAAGSDAKPRGMPAAAKKLLLVKPKIEPPLDKGFRPVVLAKRAYMEATKECTDKLEWALIRADGVGRYSLPVFGEKSREVT